MEQSSLTTASRGQLYTTTPQSWWAMPPHWEQPSLHWMGCLGDPPAQAGMGGGHQLRDKTL
eukprot:7864913-Alexandrium_andersonii.AAC.1